MIGIIAAVALAAAPQGQLRIAVPALTVIGAEAKLGPVFSEKLAQDLAAHGAQVVTDRQIATALGAERQRQLLGCADNDCMVEIANALGVDVILAGDIARIGPVVQLNLKLVSSKDAGAAASWQSTVDSEEAVLSELGRAAPVLVRDGAKAMNKMLIPNPEALERAESNERAKTFRRWAWVPAAGAGFALVGGGVGMGLAASEYAQLNSPSAKLSAAEASSTRDNGKQLQTLGIVGISAAVVLAAGSATLFYLGRDEAPPVSVAAAPSAGGGVVLFQGRLP